MFRKTDNETEHRLKRRRLDTPQFTPDGFTKTSSGHSAARTAPPPFVSAFGSDGAPSTSEKLASGRSSRLPPPVAVRNLATSSTPAKGVVSTKTPLKPLAPPVLNFSSPFGTTEDVVMRTPRKPPRILPNTTSSELQTPMKSILVTPSAVGQIQLPSSSKLASRLSSLPITPFQAPTTPSSAKEMRTIFTTRVAIATDLTTEHGQAEMQSISLQQERDVFVATTTPSELHRGLTTSPEKGDRGRGRKFVRNGLAERANQLLTRSHTALSLWQKDLEPHISITTSSTSSARPPDVHIRILDILHTMRNMERQSHTLRTALIRAEKLKPNKGEELIVLLSFASKSSSRASSAEDLGKDREVYLWMPWHEVELPPGEDFGEVVPDIEYEVLVKGPRRRYALLCSRFLIVRR